MPLSELESIIASASDWDALLSARGCDPQLIEELEGLPSSSLKAVRLAQAHLVDGRSDFALQALVRAESHPLLCAARLAIHAARYEYAPILEAPVEGAQGEARVRSLHARALALWGEHRLEEGAHTAELAMMEASTCGMTHFAAVCERLRDDCLALRLEVSPAVREQQLCNLLTRTSAAEERLETLIDLMQLMYRQGRYDESMRLSQGIPKGRQGRFFQAMSLIANGRGHQIDWAALKGGLDFGRLHAVYGLLQIDAAFVLAGPEPSVEAPLTPRHTGEWTLAFAWASMRTGQHHRALEYLERPFIHRTEWDLRLIRAVIWLELLVAMPKFTLGRCNAPAMLEDARRLLRDYLAPDSILVQSLSRAVPLAVALLIKTPGGCPALEAKARADLVILSDQGLTVGGLTRTRADSLVRVASGTEFEAPALTPQAIRAARYRLKRLLRDRGQALIVKLEDIEFARAAMAGPVW
jgi:hypothetical protein